MNVHFQFALNPGLYLRDPESSALGRSIISHSVELINEIGLEEFTFRKLAQRANTTEASIYRYFENKHRLLTYIVAWWWTWLDYQIVFHTNNVSDVKSQISIVIRLLTLQHEGVVSHPHIDRKKLFSLVQTESNKAYLNHNVSEDNKQQLFQPYKDLCARIAGLFRQYNQQYRHPRSLATTVLEMAHMLIFFKRHLPSLTDYPGPKGEKEAPVFLEHIVFSALDAKAN